MKQSPRTPTPAAPSPESNARLGRLILLLAIGAPLLDTLAIFPLGQIILANSSGTGLLFQIYSQFSELFNLASFFLLLALAVYCAFTDRTPLVGRILALHGFVSVFGVILLRLGLFLGLAWLDSALLLPFDLCNLTLTTLTKDSGARLMAQGLALFLSQVILFVLLIGISMIALFRRQKAVASGIDLSPMGVYRSFDATPLPRTLRLGALLYALLAFGNLIYDTVKTVTDYGAPDSFGTLLSLIVPYFFTGIYCLLCYLALDYGCRYFSRLAAR